MTRTRVTTCLRQARALARVRLFSRCTRISMQMVVPFPRALSMTQDPPSDFTLSVIVVRPKPFGVAGSMPLPSSLIVKRSTVDWRLAPLRRCPLSFHKVDGKVVGIPVADGVGDPFLDGAIEREVDRLAIGFGKPAC
jgi:hypothetical protein